VLGWDEWGHWTGRKYPTYTFEKTVQGGDITEG